MSWSYSTDRGATWARADAAPLSFWSWFLRRARWRQRLHPRRSYGIYLWCHKNISPHVAQAEAAIIDSINAQMFGDSINPSTMRGLPLDGVVAAATEWDEQARRVGTADRARLTEALRWWAQGREDES